MSELDAHILAASGLAGLAVALVVIAVTVAGAWVLSGPLARVLDRRHERRVDTAMDRLRWMSRGGDR